MPDLSIIDVLAGIALAIAVYRVGDRLAATWRDGAAITAAYAGLFVGNFVRTGTPYPLALALVAVATGLVTWIAGKWTGEDRALRIGLGFLVVSAVVLVLLGVKPTGGSADCSDQTESNSTHARGTCSHHGGVASWGGAPDSP